MEKFSGPLARRYGTALFGSLIELSKSNKKNFQQYVDIMQSISSSLDVFMINLMTTQTVSNEKKHGLLSDILFIACGSDKDLKETLYRFLTLVLDNNRFMIISSILDFFFEKADDYLSVIRTSVTSAKPLDAKLLAEFSDAISKATGKQLIFDHNIDESLKCGYQIKIGDLTIDSTLKSFLSQLKQSIH